MRASFPMSPRRSAALTAIGALFLVGFAYDMRTLENELGYQHRLLACIGMYEIKTNLSHENPRAICERAVAFRVAADLD